MYSPSNNKIFDLNNNIICEVNEGKGFIKEYNNNGYLRFEGEYIKGERNGKGKEYNDYGNIIYEGEYKNGKRDGEGKEYNEEGILIFEGEYLNGKKWIGKGCNNMVTEVKNGNGKVKIYNLFHFVKKA